MSKKENSLRERFAEFRPNDALKESGYLLNALQISQYVEKVKSVVDIEKDFEAGIKSATYLGFEEPYKKRTMGALLYGKLALDDYIHNNSTTPADEIDLLKSLSQLVGAFYIDPRGNINQHEKLFSQVTQWLNVQSSNSTNPEEAHKLCLTLFTMLNCLNIKMNTLNFPMSSLIPAKVPQAMKELLSLTLSTAQKLETKIAKQASSEEGKTKSMQEHFNDHYLAILNTKNDQFTILDELKKRIENNTQGIEALIKNRQQLSELEQKRNELQALLTANNENNTRITGRKYFLEFIENNQHQFNILMETLPQNQKNKFMEVMRPLQMPTMSESAKATALNIMSWLTTPTTIIARALPLNRIKESLTDVMPDTQDSLCKSQLKQLTSETIAVLLPQIIQKQQDILKLEEDLSAGNGALHKLIENGESKDLKDIIQTNRLAVMMIETYKEVMEPIIKFGKQLDEEAKATADFIKENDNWKCKVTDFFSRFGVWFSTESLSDKLDGAKTFQNELKNLRSKYDNVMQKKATQFAKLNASNLMKENLQTQMNDSLDKAKLSNTAKGTDNQGSANTAIRFKERLSKLQKSFDESCLDDEKILSNTN